ncbi:MAG: ribose 5-phosphate isomerase B [Erysipelotrichaceae bacterium]|nr:ribose 5-phosphate isomerase B [Erysipelotrichaceae bacterium]
MRVGIANDHAATDLKFKVMEHLKEEGYEVINYGFDTHDSVDYPIAGEKLAMGIKNNECDLGIAICGTGVGISIACNKVKGIRAGVCSETKTAALIREHNDAQIIAFGARIVDEKTAYELVDTFLTTPFSNGERHIKRINMLKEIEDRQ